MTLVVETGSGSASSESYAAVADCAAYATKFGKTFPASPVDAAEAALRRGTARLDGKYHSRFPGCRTNGRDQGLEWPRVGACDAEGYAIASDEIPQEIIDACCELAIIELADPGSLSPTVTPGQIEKRIKVDTIEVEYAATSTSVYDQRPVPTVVDDILSSLLTGSASSYVARAVRA